MSGVFLGVLPTQVSTLICQLTFTSQHAYIYTALYLPKATTQTSHSTQESGGGGVAQEVGLSCGQIENPVLTTVNSTGCPWVLESNTNSALAQIHCCRLHLIDVLHTYTSKITHTPPPLPTFGLYPSGVLHTYTSPKIPLPSPTSGLYPSGVLHFLKNTPPLAHFCPVPKWCVRHLHLKNAPPLTHFWPVPKCMLRSYTSSKIPLPLAYTQVMCYTPTFSKIPLRLPTYGLYPSGVYTLTPPQKYPFPHPPLACTQVMC